MSSVRAPAKLTLTLRITSVRSDGYHELDVEMVSLSLADTLTFSDGDGLTVGGPHCSGVPMDDSNLVRRALALIGRTASVHVEKQIPSGAGLGGGSADAAAVLRWAGVDDLVVAARLGADVPFCLVGGRARVRGIGDRITPLPLRRPLVHPDHAAAVGLDGGRVPSMGRSRPPDRAGT